MLQHLFKVILVPLSLLCAEDNRAEWIHSANLSVASDDNVTLGHQPRDIAEHTYSQAAWTANYQWFTKGNSRFRIGPGLSYTRSHNFSGLDSRRFSLEAGYARKLGVGRFAPSVDASISFGIDNAQDDFRDGRRYEISAGYRKPLTDRFDLSLYIRQGAKSMRHKKPYNAFIESTGLTTDVFDTHALEASIALDVYLNPRWLLVLDYTRRTGDVTSITRPDRSILDASTALGRDEVFGDQWVAYRIDADTSIVSVNASFEFTRHIAIDATYEYRDADSPGGLSYRNDLVSVGVNYVF